MPYYWPSQHPSEPTTTVQNQSSLFRICRIIWPIQFQYLPICANWNWSYYLSTTNKSNHFIFLSQKEWLVRQAFDKFWIYKVYVTASKGIQKINRVNFFPTKNRLLNSNPIDHLSAALEDLKHECTPSNAIYPVVKSKHGTNLNKVMERVKELFQSAITTASNLINDLSTSKITPNLVLRVAGTLLPRVDTIPIHKNSTSL